MHLTHISHRQAVRLAITGIALCILLEGCAAIHYIGERNVWEAFLVVLSWFREGLRSILEKLTEAVMGTAQ
jgi:hypothetical protein